MLTDLESSPAALRSPDPIVVPSFVPDNVEDLAVSTPRPDWLPRRYFLFVGALGAHKGLDVLIRAYEDLLRESSAADDLPSLVCIGTPTPHGPPIPDGVVARHNVEHSEVMAAWRAATAAIVPSRWAEPFGQVTVEAMLAGAPVIASATGGLLDLVLHEATGLLVAPGDAGALQAAMRRLLDEPQLSEELTRRARNYARRFTAGPVVEQIESIYRRAIAATPTFVRIPPQADH
jgi:Glycosyltransferase